MTALRWTLLLVAALRLGELAWAGRNTARLRRRGAIEADSGGHPFFVALHAGWLGSLALFVPGAAPVCWPLLGAFALLQAGRLWVILSLGPYWTTRILSLPGASLVRAGPYRWVRHPNYLIVTAELAVLPLAFGAVAIAVTFSALNLALITRRIAIEDRILAPRRSV